jgi:hypothetical protein
MAFVKLDKVPRNSFGGAVDFPALILNTGKSNSAINNHAVRKMGFKKGEPVCFDILTDDEDKTKFAISVNPEGMWKTKVTKARQIALWLGSFFWNNEIYLRGYFRDAKKIGERIVCPLTKDGDVWTFSIPAEYFVKKEDTYMPKAEAVIKPAEGIKILKKKKKKIIAG